MAEFRALIEEARGGGAWVQVPSPAVTELGGGGRIPVHATFDGTPYQGSVVSMTGANKPDTRQRRIGAAIEELAQTRPT